MKLIGKTKIGTPPYAVEMLSCDENIFIACLDGSLWEIDLNRMSLKEIIKEHKIFRKPIIFKNNSDLFYLSGKLSLLKDGNSDLREEVEMPYGEKIAFLFMDHKNKKIAFHGEMGDYFYCENSANIKRYNPWENVSSALNHPHIDDTIFSNIIDSCYVYISNSGRILAVNSYDEESYVQQVWSIPEGKFLRESRQSPEENLMFISCTGRKSDIIANVVFNKKYNNYKIVIQKTDSGTIISEIILNTEITSMCFNENDNYIAAGTKDGGVRIFDIKSGDNIASVKRINGDIKGEHVLNICFAGKSKIAVLTNISSQIIIYELKIRDCL